jgi:hypothetical protein
VLIRVLFIKWTIKSKHLITNRRNTYARKNVWSLVILRTGHSWLRGWHSKLWKMLGTRCCEDAHEDLCDFFLLGKYRENSKVRFTFRNVLSGFLGDGLFCTPSSEVWGF